MLRALLGLLLILACSCIWRGWSLKLGSRKSFKDVFASCWALKLWGFQGEGNLSWKIHSLYLPSLISAPSSWRWYSPQHPLGSGKPVLGLRTHLPKAYLVLCPESSVSEAPELRAGVCYAVPTRLFAHLWWPFCQDQVLQRHSWFSSGLPAPHRSVSSFIAVPQFFGTHSF